MTPKKISFSFYMYLEKTIQSNSTSNYSLTKFSLVQKFKNNVCKIELMKSHFQHRFFGELDQRTFWTSPN